MARPLRIEYENAYYHVMNRGRGRQWVFLGADYFQDFLKGLEEAHKRFGIEIHAYCLMGNHYHLLIKTPRGNLSRAMRHIDGLYTQRHNRRRKTDGSLFRGRYKAILIDASSYLLQVSRYIHRNPVETKTPIVEELIDYPWSSYSAYLNKAKVPEWLNRESVFGELSSRNRYSAYRTYVEQGCDQEITEFYQRKNYPAVMGDQSFKDFAQTQAQSLSTEIDKTGLRQPIPMPVIVKVVADYFQLKEKDICIAKRGPGTKNVPRWIAMKLCQEVGGEALIDIAVHFHVNHYSTVSKTIQRLNQLLGQDPEVARDLNRLSQDLTP